MTAMLLPSGVERSLVDPFDPFHHGSTKYPFEAMEVGDYFFVDTVGPIRQESIRQCARGWARRRGLVDRRFSVRLIEREPGQPPSRTMCVRVR
jgi:hypothetical protein